LKNIEPETDHDSIISKWFTQSDVMPPIQIHYMVKDLVKALIALEPIVTHIEQAIGIFKIESIINTGVFLFIASIVILFFECLVPLTCLSLAVGILYNSYSGQAYEKGLFEPVEKDKIHYLRNFQFLNTSMNFFDIGIKGRDKFLIDHLFWGDAGKTLMTL
jgi:hypothetical protein